MATNIQLKRSATSGAAPGTGDLELGELALNTYDGKMYMKKTVSGTSSIVELTGTQAATSSAFAHDSYKYTASSNQTSFSGSDADSKTLAYTAGQIQVYLNGVLLDAADYTASNGTAVVLGSGATSGAILYIVSFKGTNPFDYFKYTASNAQTSFSGNDANSESLVYTAGNITVHLNGVLLDASDYTATNGTAVVLASGASSGDILVIHEFNETGLTQLTNDTSPQLAGNLDVVTYDIVSTSNRDIDIVPHGTGDVTLQTDTVTMGSSGENVTVSTSGTGDLTLNTNGGSSSGSIAIADGANANITLTPNGSGKIVLDNHSWPNSDGSANQVLITNGSGVLSFSTISSDSISDTDGNTKIQVEESSDEDIIRFDIAGTEQIVLADGVLKPTTTNDIDLGTSSLEFKDAFFDGTVTSDAFAGPLTGDVTGTADLATSITASANNSTDETVYPTFVDGATGTQGIETDTGLTYNPSSGLLTTTLLAGTLNTAAQTNITSLGTLTALTVDNISLNGTTIGHTGDTDLMTLASGVLTVAGDVYVGGSNKELRFYEGSNYVGFEAPALSANQIWVLPTADGSANQTLKTDGSGTLSWATAASAMSNLTDATISSVASGDMLRYNGSAWVNQATAVYPVLDTMTGDNSDTTLTLTRTPLHENAVQVYWDGVYQHKDNWAVSGTTLTFATAPPTGVKVEAVTGSQTDILYGHDVTVDKMTGDNSDTTLTLSVTPSNENHTNIFFDGVYQSKDNYTVSGTTVTFSTAPPTGVLVEAVSNQSVSVGTATAIAASAVTGLTEVTAADADHVMIYDASGSALKKSLVSDLVQTGEEIADIVGAMVSSNTESGITVAYQDGDNTIDFTVGTLNQDTTGTADNITATANNSTDETVYPTFVDGATGSQGIETDTGLTYNPSSGLLTTTLLAGTLNTAAQTNITSVGTLTSFRSTGIDDNTDALAMTLDSSERVLIGHTSSIPGITDMKLQVNATDSTGSIQLTRWTDNAIGSYLSFCKSRNGTIGSNTVVQDGDGLGQITWNGDDGTDLNMRSSAIYGRVDGTPGSNDMPGRLEFITTPDGQAFDVNNIRMSIKSDGKIGIGDTAPQDWLEVRSSGAIGGITISNSSHDQAALSFARNAAATARIFTTEPGATHTGSMHFQTGIASGPALVTAMTIDENQNVGIGTTSPGGMLETYKSADNTKHWRIHRPGTAEFGIGVAGSYLHISDSSSMPSGSSKGIYMKFNTGEVGIGVPVPTTHFSVAKSANITQVALTSSSAAVAWDAKAAANAYHLTTENTTFSAPSNAVEGAIISVEIAQGGTARTIAWNTVFEFAASTAPTITATASKTDILSFRYNGSVWQEIGRVQNMAQT